MLRVTLDVVQVTEADVARIPVGNLRVPRADFVAVWTAATKASAARASAGVTDWYVGGVAATCRWLAGGTITPSVGRPYPARAPVTRRSARASEELIEAEYVAAELLNARSPRPQWLVERPGWSEAICATFRWAWRRSGPSPLPLEQRVAG